MSKISTVGIDLAKNTFQICAMSKAGKVIFNKKFPRSKVLDKIKSLDKEEDFHIAMETCAGSNYWGQIFQSNGYKTLLIAPKFVKPYVMNNKNDYHDAQAIAEASTRPEMRFVGVKNKYQQDIKAIHNIRESLVKRRTALANEIRGILFEYGIVIPKGINYIKTHVKEIIEEEKVSGVLLELIKDLFDELSLSFERVNSLNQKLETVYKESEVCKRIGEVEGVGVITATAIFAEVGDPRTFKNGREFAAWLGLTPRQASTGGKTILLGISKRGNKYIRKNLIQGSQAVLKHSKKKIDPKSIWLNDKIERCGKNKAVIALANKNARVIWKLMVSEEKYIK
jgi:transposase